MKTKKKIKRIETKYKRKLKKAGDITEAGYEEAWQIIIDLRDRLDKCKTRQKKIAAAKKALLKQVDKL